jgi:hypothetical protein
MLDTQHLAYPPLTAPGIQPHRPIGQCRNEVYHRVDDVILASDIPFSELTCVRLSRPAPAHISTKALFSTTFFRFADQGWEVSNKLWLYWAVTGPTTLLVLGLHRLYLDPRARQFLTNLKHMWS